MIYKTTLDFKRGPSFSIEVDALDEATAKRIAVMEAPKYGFTDPIKRVRVVALATEQN